MSLTVWAGAPDSFIRLDCDGVGRFGAFPVFLVSAENRKKPGNVLLSHQAPLAVPSAP